MNEKKLSGEFFTPSSVVDFMINKTFDQLYTSGKILDNNFSRFQESLLKLKFCDPAVGTGNFILGLLRYVWKRILSYGNVTTSEQNKFLKSFAKNCIYGVEIKKSSLDLCKTRIVKLYQQLKNADLKNLKVGNSLVDLDAYEILNNDVKEQLFPFSWAKSFSSDIVFDVIIGNPPYFNLKKMILRDENIQLLYDYLKKSRNWKTYFRSSSDVYYYFIIRSIKLLKKNGLLVLILPNYWIENKYADILRENLLKNQILDIYDFGELNVFKDEGKWLNVSTCVLILEKIAPYREITITKNIPRNFFRKEGIKVNSFSVNSSDLSKDKWILSPYIDKIKKIERNKDLVQLSSIATVAQGMSPGVKSIFVLHEEEIIKRGIETEVTVPFVTNKHVKKWMLEKINKHHAILPSLIQNLNDFPNTQKYLKENRKDLEKGSDRQRLLSKKKIRWFDFSVYRNLDLFLKRKEKILCPYRSLSPRFSLDKKGYFCATDIYGIFPDNPKDLYSLLGILNSSFMEFWFREVGKRKGKMLEFFSDPLKKLFIPNKDKRVSINQEVKDILKITDKNSNRTNEVKEIEQVINQKVAQMYNLNLSFVQKYLKKNNLS